MKILNQVKAMGKGHFFITNHGSKTSASLVAELASLGVSTDQASCHVPSSAAAEFLSTKALPSKKVLVMGEQGIFKALEDGGFEPFRLQDY